MCTGKPWTLCRRSQPSSASILARRDSDVARSALLQCKACCVPLQSATRDCSCCVETRTAGHSSLQRPLLCVQASAQATALHGAPCRSVPCRCKCRSQLCTEVCASVPVWPYLVVGQHTPFIHHCSTMIPVNCGRAEVAYPLTCALQEVRFVGLQHLHAPAGCWHCITTHQEQPISLRTGSLPLSGFGGMLQRTQ
jgi:hypothetical protein